MTALVLKPTQEEWQNKRCNQIGASELATIAGVSKYGNIVDLWNKKVNHINENIDNEAMLWGHAFEDGVAQLFEHKTGLEVIKSSTGDWQFVQEGAEWMSCSPDRTYWLNKDEKHNARDWQSKGLLECKTTVSDPEKEGNEWMLQSWYCQVQWQLLVSEMKEAHLCCAVFGYERKTIIKHWPANPEFQAKLLGMAKAFWFDNVQGKVAPTPRTKEEVDALFPKEVTGKSVEADEEAFKQYAELQSINANIKMLQEKQEELKGELILAMGDAERLEMDGKVLCTYKAPKDTATFDKKAFQSENPDMYDKYVKMVPNGRRFLLK